MKLPKGITISDLEFEGPELVIYTTEPKAFADNGDIIRSLARTCASGSWSALTRRCCSTRSRP